jgi:uncharacterized YigZ family protein
MNDYKTIAKISEGLYKEKGSKFLAFAHPISDIEACKILFKEYKSKYFDARHVCFAYLINPENEQHRAFDDGEPSGSAGIPILGQIKSFGLCNVMVVVVRYFGGTKLGVSGLIHAYKTAAQDALNQAEVIERIIQVEFKICFNYLEMNKIMKIIKTYKIEILDQTSHELMTYRIGVNKEFSHQVREELADFISGK